jgi:chorismate mutase
MQRLWAVRGATSTEKNTKEQILSATKELLEEILLRNPAEEIVSVFLTATPDLSAAFPAQAARELGMDDVALISAQEIDVPEAPERTIRVLMHYYGDKDDKPDPVYQNRARRLRPDLVVTPAEVLSALKEIEKELGPASTQPITTKDLVSRTLGKGPQDKTTDKELSLFKEAAFRLQLDGQIGCMAASGPERIWFTLPSPR